MSGAAHDTDTGSATRRPRLALMGEFSAGKSTLSNLLLGRSPLPTRVTATRLPPVWMSRGEDAVFAVGHDGSEREITLDDLDSIDLAETRLIRLFLDSELLELCDLIDMPGISDPNMSSEVWQSVFDLADSVIWCTHATQAWRQSEAATWESLRELTRGENLLLVTQFDKLVNERDRARVLARVRKETEGQFAAVYPVSLLKALQAGDDVAAWEASGAAAFTNHMVDLLLSQMPEEDGGLARIFGDTPYAAEEDGETAQAMSGGFEENDEREEAAAEPPVDAVSDEERVIPKRVRARGTGSRTERLPHREDGAYV
ncbi:dynamin family protein [Seohaeicola zhoushanensis]|nr:dynamin family protein [Seohaeicola zhoushanensis]